MNINLLPLFASNVFYFNIDEDTSELDPNDFEWKQLGKNNFVVTFKTEDEVLEYFKMHNGEEQRLLWLGFFIANNFIADRLEQEGLELAKPWPPKEKK